MFAGRVSSRRPTTTTDGFAHTDSPFANEPLISRAKLAHARPRASRIAIKRRDSSRNPPAAGWRGSTPPIALRRVQSRARMPIAPRIARMHSTRARPRARIESIVNRAPRSNAYVAARSVVGSPVVCQVSVTAMRTVAASPARCAPTRASRPSSTRASHRAPARAMAIARATDGA